MSTSEVKEGRIRVNLEAASPTLRRTYLAYEELSPKARADVHALCMTLVEAMHLRGANTHFGPAMALELLGCLVEKGIL